MGTLKTKQRRQTDGEALVQFSLDGFHVLSLNFGGKWKKLAESGHQGHQLLECMGAGSIDQEREPLNKFSSPFHGSGWSHSQPLISAFPLIVDKREKPSMDHYMATSCPKALILFLPFNTLSGIRFQYLVYEHQSHHQTIQCHYQVSGILYI